MPIWSGIIQFNSFQVYLLADSTARGPVRIIINE
jgi:hypothetical protein